MKSPAPQRKKIEELLLQIASTGELRLSEELKHHTSFRIGGPAEYLLIPSSRAGLIKTVRQAAERGIPYHILGGGTNLLVADNGIRGLVVKIGPSLGSFYFQANRLLVESGCLISRLSHLARKKGLSGLEFAVGLPGTVGGAVAMNAGCWGNDIAGILSRVTILLPHGEVRSLPPVECAFAYRSSRFRNPGEIILAAEFKLIKAPPESVGAKMEKYLQERKKRFPPASGSAGCIFKNTPRDSAGGLIEALGLKGRRVGNARVSLKHANFIVNLGGARQSDVGRLIELIRRQVWARFHLRLELEIKCWGDAS